jgi:uncharacterized protein (TIGR03000 family)
MYSLVMLAAMTASPDVPQNWMCPVTPSNYGSTFWSKHSFYDCCAPARYGWVNCWNKGFGYYPGDSRGFSGCCTQSYGHFYMPSPCACNSCGNSAYAGGVKGGCGWCGCGWPIGNQPAYYSSVLGCPPCISAPPYAYYTEHNPCCKYGNFAFDTGLIGHSAGVGYSGFGGYGNFGFYGAVPMIHPPSTNDLPPFPRDYRMPSAVPIGPAPMPPLPKGVSPPMTPELPIPPIAPPTMPPGDTKKDEPKKEEPKKEEKKERLQQTRPAPATVVLCVPDAAVVTVNGEPLTSTGRERSFRTPDLQSGQEYAYTVRAVVIVGGREEVESKQVTVAAGETSRASFEKLFARVGDGGKSIAGAR